MPLEHFKPAVPKHWLIAIAGLVWSAAGAILCHGAWTWLRPLPSGRALALSAAGLGLAVVFHRVMLAPIADRNMGRICSYAERGCVFAFQAWRSYLVILTMMAMGFLLRHTPISRQILALLYSAMGGALILASLSYFRLFWRVRLEDAACLPGNDDPSL
ncbi:MAG: hypothetical protein PVJ53_17025 [Desulfobacterales bacterium]|jgi:hypothetical protein